MAMVPIKTQRSSQSALNLPLLVFSDNGAGKSTSPMSREAGVFGKGRGAFMDSLPLEEVLERVGLVFFSGIVRSVGDGFDGVYA